jgi:hypothetical protein
MTSKGQHAKELKQHEVALEIEGLIVKGEGIETKRALDGSNDIVVGATGGETLEQPEFAEVSRRQIFLKGVVVGLASGTTQPCVTCACWGNRRRS